MILLFLKITLLLALTLAATVILQRSSAALRHLICACGLAGALLLALTLIEPPAVAVFHISSAALSTSSRMNGAARSVALPVAWLWLAGTTILLGRIALGYRSLAALLGTAEASQVDGIVFADVSVPVVSGLMNPVILLPRSARQWRPERKEAALRHEYAHIRRNDLWTLLLSHMACAVYWFHPLVWMAAAQLRREQEQACDDAVILSGFEPASYAEALLATAQNLSSTRLIGCHMLTKHTFRTRIARLLAHGRPRVSSSSTLRRAAIVFGAAVITIGLLSGKPQPPDQNDVYRVGGGVTAPQVVFKAEPEYSEEARRAKVAGTVLLSVVIGTDWFVHDINVIKGLGSGLDEKAVEAVRKWQFRPGTKDGQPVKVHAQIEINFRLWEKQ
jgi:TonB family protein